MIIENTVIVELKAVRDLKPEHEWQLLNYLKATGIEVGLLINFGLSLQQKRKILTNHKRKEYTGIRSIKQ